MKKTAFALLTVLTLLTLAACSRPPLPHELAGHAPGEDISAPSQSQGSSTISNSDSSTSSDSSASSSGSSTSTVSWAGTYSADDVYLTLTENPDGTVTATVKEEIEASFTATPKDGAISKELIMQAEDNAVIAAGGVSSRTTYTFNFVLKGDKMLTYTRTMDISHYGPVDDTPPDHLDYTQTDIIRQTP